ncbi:MAG: autotransporter assembly complex protein TamA [Geminicoccaceae bacterium]
MSDLDCDRRARRRRVPVACPVIGLLLAACQPTGAPEEPSPPAASVASPGSETAAESLQKFPYTVAFEGVEGDLKGLLEQVSQMKRLTDRPPDSLVRLRRRAQDDVDRFDQALRSRGYYDGKVEIAIDGEAKPIRVTFKIEPGALYKLRHVEIEADPPEPRLELPSPADLGIAPGNPALAQAVLDAEQTLLAKAKEQGFALAQLGERRAVVDHDTRTMDLTIRLKPGPLAHFGPVQVSGLQEVKEDFVRRLLPWRDDARVTPARLDEARQALLDTNLFSSVRTEPAERLDGQGRLPVTVVLSESKHRSIGAGVRYRTDEGPGGNLSWENRNFFGRGEQLKLELDASGIGGFLAGTFRKPAFLDRRQALVVQSRAAYENTDAFKSRSASAGVALERTLARGMKITAGPAFRAARIEDSDNDEDSFGLLSLPADFSWDRSNDLLDPTRGGRLSAANEPFVDTFGSGVVFNRTRLGYTHYLKVHEAPRIVLAGRVAVGSLVGAAREDVPADERFYAGGGGSVRGFGFQMAGDLDEDGNPRGGRSLFEASGEIRARFTETLGGVLFVDAGSVFEPQFPTFDEPLRIGVGPGLRYFSPIGPFGLDVGFPVNRRDEDDAFQIYISLGQAF